MKMKNVFVHKLHLIVLVQLLYLCFSLKLLNLRLEPLEVRALDLVHLVAALVELEGRHAGDAAGLRRV